MHQAANRLIARGLLALGPLALGSLALGLLASISCAINAQETKPRSLEVFFGNRPKELKVAITGPLSIDSPKYAFRVGKVITMAGNPIDNAVILCEDSKIMAIGRASETVVPDGYEVIDFKDSWCTPGLVDLHCHVAGKNRSDYNDMNHLANPEMRTWDLISMENDLLAKAVAGGVTTVLFIPGSGTNIGGFGSLTKTWGRTAKEALIRFPGCMKIAQAGNPERRNGDLGMTNLGMNQGLRMMLELGRDYAAAWEAFDQGKGEKPKHRPDLEYLRGLFRHEYPVCVHTQGYQVVLQTLRELRQEFGLWTVIVHGTFDSFQLAGEARRLGVPVCNGPRQFYLGPDFLGKLDTGSTFTGCASAWHSGGTYNFRAPVLGVGDEGIGINTDSPVVAQEQLIVQCAMAVRLGLPDYVGMRAITTNPAHFAGIDHRVGTVETGKDADLVFWSGDPLDLRNHVKMTIVNGCIAYQRAPSRPRF